ncbi:EpsG family protein [Vibrio cholerae]|uniref:EpsG family protein n=1 Tax=Vibrio cholerae TaxID=666 RepID=UPI0011D4EE08|nr:EpsG family protein [Vibrio cholerae]EGQ8592775.1 hypothetical protein [Vibrio cholerae]EGQ8662271.1 hypothetical protein [Vibrio cholerae]EGR4133495.1 EpsG family protein [Vibrio cholerae]TXZ20864.1 EpsG family protein [Vibrio cholerae]GIA50151.1 Transmembrane protein EpsG [Vibrio cholerae]
MLIYIILLVVLALLALVEFKSKFLFLFFFVVMFLISALRSFVGSDYKNYYDVFVNYPKDRFAEPVFNYAITFFKYLSLPPSSFFIFVSFFTILFLFKSIKNANVPVFFALFLFIATRGYFESFNIIRQYLVITIMLYSVGFLSEDNRSRRKFFLTTILCVFIHYSAIFYMVMYFFIVRKFNTFFWVLMILISLISVEFNIVPLNFIPPIYHSYVDTSHFSRSEFSGVGLGFLLFNLIAVIIAIYYDKISVNRRLSLYLNMYFIGVLLQNISFQAIIFRRFSVAFLIAQIIVIPYLISLIKCHKQRFWARLVVLLLFFVLFLRGIELDSNYLEYNWILSDMIVF